VEGGYDGGLLHSSPLSAMSIPLPLKDHCRLYPSGYHFMERALSGRQGVIRANAGPPYKRSFTLPLARTPLATAWRRTACWRPVHRILIPRLCVKRHGASWTLTAALRLSARAGVWVWRSRRTAAFGLSLLMTVWIIKGAREEKRRTGSHYLVPTAGMVATTWRHALSTFSSSFYLRRDAVRLAASLTRQQVASTAVNGCCVPDAGMVAALGADGAAAHLVGSPTAHFPLVPRYSLPALPAAGALRLPGSAGSFMARRGRGSRGRCAPVDEDWCSGCKET